VVAESSGQLGYSWDARRVNNLGNFPCVAQTRPLRPTLETYELARNLTLESTDGFPC